MDYIFLVTGSIIIITCFYFIISPFFSTTVHSDGLIEQVSGEASSVDSIYRSVNELEMDFLMKKISEADFIKMKEHYQMLAADFLKGEQNPKVVQGKTSSKEVDMEILRELETLRRQKGR
ncbi:hypothetical protein [Mesobacillus harenae]|uniref:hypothetical protein n=1 Tax=Mesobacillus harenae TaxID=2213203 RepID=UPI00157FF737|nr:hypothetical protein [Mesobacillus harenae]